MGKTVGMDDLIVVRGTAVSRISADRATLTITARVKQPTAADAERALAELTSAVDSVLDDFSAVVTSRRTEHFSIRPNTNWHAPSGANVVDGQVGERGIRITVADMGRAGALIRVLYDAAGVEVNGPEWELADDNPVHGQTRRAAARDARQRAEQYAEGLGLSVGGVAFVREPGLRSEPPGLARALAFVADAEMEAEPVIDLGSALIQLSASVEVGFHIEPT